MKKKIKITAIVQARSTSVRFPKKVLQKINGKTLVEIVNIRLKKSKLIQKIIFVIPKEKSEVELRKVLNKNKINFFEGSKEDVLDRFYQCAVKNPTDIIVRITGDCPLIDPYLIDKGLKLFLRIKKSKSILTNYLPPTFPNGVDFSIFTFFGLKIAWENAKTNYEREHVVPFMINSKNFIKHKLINKVNHSDLRITVDEPKDLIVVKKIFKQFKNFNFKIEKVIDLWKKNKKIFNENKYIMRDEGSKMNFIQKIIRRYRNKFF